MQKQNKKPFDFLVIGAQKCATSWLYHVLKDHPEIGLPINKKEIEYLGGEIVEVNGHDWYFNLIRNKEGSSIYGDVSVEYLLNSKSISLINNYNDKCKFILSLRDPYDRIKSAYKWYFRRGYINMNFEKTIFQAFYDLDNGIESKYSDLLKRSYYSLYFKPYLNSFSSEQFLVIFYNDIDNNPHSIIKLVYKFLGINIDFIPGSLKIKPKKSYDSSFFIKASNIFNKFNISAKIFDWVFSRIYVNFKSDNTLFEFNDIDLKNRLELFCFNAKEELNNLLKEHNGINLSKSKKL